MLRYKTETRPGLVVLYDIRPGYGAGLFLQPQSPHGEVGAGVNCRQKKCLRLLQAFLSCSDCMLHLPY